MNTKVVGLLSVIALSGCVPPMVEQNRDTNKPVIITNYYQQLPNSAGGIKLHLTAYNMTDKPIKYFDFWAKHYDRVKEQQLDAISGVSTKGYRFTGPYLKEKVITGNFGPIFYSHSATCMMLDKVEITYMDDTKVTYQGKELDDINVVSGYKCRNSFS